LSEEKAHKTPLEMQKMNRTYTFWYLETVRLRLPRLALK
jgi:hypothetical protein